MFNHIERIIEVWLYCHDNLGNKRFEGYDDWATSRKVTSLQKKNIKEEAWDRNTTPQDGNQFEEERRKLRQ